MNSRVFLTKWSVAIEVTASGNCLQGERFDYFP